MFLLWERASQLAYHTLYLFQVLTLDRGTTSGGWAARGVPIRVGARMRVTTAANALGERVRHEVEPLRGEPLHEALDRAHRDCISDQPRLGAGLDGEEAGEAFAHVNS